ILQELVPNIRVGLEDAWKDASPGPTSMRHLVIEGAEVAGKNYIMTEEETEKMIWELQDLFRSREKSNLRSKELSLNDSECTIVKLGVGELNADDTNEMTKGLGQDEIEVKKPVHPKLARRNYFRLVSSILRGREFWLQLMESRQQNSAGARPQATVIQGRTLSSEDLPVGPIPSSGFMINRHHDHADDHNDGNDDDSYYDDDRYYYYDAYGRMCSDLYGDYSVKAKAKPAPARSIHFSLRKLKSK
ncbi:hypothetical protein BGZ83_001894, partial [Gryganskiella cystojenkinii]